jgi:DNA-binding LacI/PurR family transcriptional regulator
MTQKEIAEKLKVSQMTVSRALNGSSLVKQKLKKRILQEMEKSNYVINVNARNLNLNKNGAIGVLLSGIDTIESHYFSKSFVGINEEANTRHINLLVFDIENEKDIEQRLPSLLAKLDGLIIYNLSQMKNHLQAVVELLKKYDKPHVLIQSSRDLGRNNYVTVDNIDAGKKAVEYLISLGHRKIAFLGDLSESECLERLDGYKKALSSHGLSIKKEWIIQRGTDDYANVSLQKVYGNKNNFPTAIFAWSDNFARIAIYYLRSIGIDVPNEVSVIGFDDSQAFVYMDRPHLTTVQQPLRKIGLTAVKAILSKNGMTSPALAKASIIERESCKKI